MTEENKSPTPDQFWKQIEEAALSVHGKYLKAAGASLLLGCIAGDLGMTLTANVAMISLNIFAIAWVLTFLLIFFCAYRQNRKSGK